MTVQDLWPSVEALLGTVERPSRYLDREWNAVHAPEAAYRAVLVYPDAYEVGQANQGIQILYSIVNGLPDTSAERAFVPWLDLSSALRGAGVPLFSLESSAPVSSFDLIGITIPYELTYTNILEALDLAGVPLRSADRRGVTPLVVGGGPCAFNPEPLAPFFDAIALGDGEDVIVDIIETHRAAKAAGSDRQATLQALSRIEGVYVPAIHTPSTEDGGVAPLVRKRVVADIGAHRSPVCPVVPFADVVHDRLTVEVLRGCTRGCRFCQAGMVYRPVRERGADDIVRDVMSGLACTGYDEVSLTSLSSTDHSQIAEILRRLTSRLEGTGVSVSLPSLRVDSFGVEMARLVAAGKRPGLTLAPEAGSQRLRDVINKNVTEDQLLSAIEGAFAAGWRRVKLYFMIGLPTETDDDVAAIGELVSRALERARAATPGPQRGSVRIAVSVSTFVPKAHTPFQWEAQLTREEIEHRQEVLRASIPRKGVDLSWHDADVSLLEGVLARGDRSVADAIEAAWRAGARFDAWSEQFSLDRWLRAFEECGIDPASIASRERPIDELLPWDHLSSGVSRAWLARERERAYRGARTEDCSFGRCVGCDVCDDLGVRVLLGGDARER